MDWLFLWLIFSGGCHRHVTVETPELQEERRKAEAEALARMIGGVGKFLSSGLGTAAFMALIWAAFPTVIDMLGGGNFCNDPSVSTVSSIVKFLTRC